MRVLIYIELNRLSINYSMASEIKMNRASAKKLLDSLQTDLRNLSSESKRKHPEVKDVS